MFRTPTRSPPPCVPGVAGTTLYQQLKAWQPYSLTHWENHNEVLHRHAAVQGMQQPHVTPYYTGNRH